MKNSKCCDEPLVFNRYDLLESLNDKTKIDKLMALANKYAKKSKSKMMEIFAPTRRRGKSVMQSISHYELDGLMEELEKKIEKNDLRFVSSWKATCIFQRQSSESS